MPRPPTDEDFAALERAQDVAAAAEASPRPPLLQGPKRHHFVPQFYLEGFARNGLVAVYDRQTGEVRKQQPKNTTVIGHFYTMTDAEGRRRFELEALFSEYEGRAKRCIKVLAGGGELDADQRSDLSIFLAFAAMRTPDMVNSVQAMNGELIRRIAKQTFADADAVFDRLRADAKNKTDSDEELREQARLMVHMTQNDGFVVNTNEKWALQTTVKMSFEIAPLLAGRNWLVMHRADERQSFVTTDAPVVLSALPTRERPSMFDGPGFGTSNALISVALDQGTVLNMFGFDGDTAHRTATREQVRSINLHHAAHCQRYVLGRDEALVTSLAKKIGLAGKSWRPKMGIS